MNIGSAFPGKYIKASDLQGKDVTVVIREVHIEDVGNKSKSEEKPVVYFQGKDKGFVLNKTNANVITKLYGAETDDWIGKPIILYPTEVEFQGDMVESIRVRTKAPAAPAKAPAKPAAKAAKPAEDDEGATAIPEEDIPF